MPRLIAFTFFLMAAFAWVPPYIDRAGLAALGFAFLAISVGRGAGVPRPSTSALGLRPEGEDVGDLEALGAQLRESLAQYGMAGGTGSSSVPGNV